MSITMQGAWTVTVKSTSAGAPQQFVISGADVGNGTYEGKAGKTVNVDGESWLITVQADVGGQGYVSSAHRIKFPVASGGKYEFDIETNDAWPGDEDFNDLILTCSMPQTATDFLIYGHVAWYTPSCLFNPCFTLYTKAAVIEGYKPLLQALKYPALRDALEKLYPERVRETRQPIPWPPDPGPYRPLVISFLDDGVLPPKRVQLLKLTEVPSEPAPQKSKEASPAAPAVASMGTMAMAQSPKAKLDLNQFAIAGIVDKLKRFCDSGPVPGVLLRFQEYDRTNAELAGGPYTGEGDREDLGQTVTDINGNYIFRFSRSIPEFVGEALADVPIGGNVVVQSMPDVIVQVIDPMAPTGVIYESAPYWNIPLLRRINICIPEGLVHPWLLPCHGAHIIQAMGSISVGPVQSDGSRVGVDNTLTPDGVITAKELLAPQARCAAWAGGLDLRACLSHEEIKYYTIRYRKKGATDWEFFQQVYTHVHSGAEEKVGPFGTSLHVDGSATKSPVPAYKNIENKALWPDWREANIHRKARITSAIYEGGEPGPVEFRIEGYKGDGHRPQGADETITLYLDNSSPKPTIDENITMGAQTLGNCALFELPENSPAAPLTVRFKVDQKQGFLSRYELHLLKGAAGGFAVKPDPSQGPPYRACDYEHGSDDKVCNQLRGTPDDTTADQDDFVSVEVTPAAGTWLAPDEQFCAFSVNLTASVRVTDGYSTFGPYNATPVLIGIQEYQQAQQE